MRKLQWKPSEGRDTLPPEETVIVLCFMALIAICLKIAGVF